MKKGFTINSEEFKRQKELYDKRVTDIDNEISDMRKQNGSSFKADPKIIGVKETIVEYTKKINERKEAFVQECKPIISDIFFFDENYKNSKEFELSIIKKYPELWENRSFGTYLTLFEPDYSELTFDKCLSFVNDENLKNYSIRKPNGHNGKITRDLTNDLKSINKENINIAVNKRNSLLRRKKIFDIFKIVGKRIGAKIEKVEREINERTMLASFISDIDTKILRASFAVCELYSLSSSKNLKDIKLYENVYKPYERSLKKSVKANKSNFKDRADDYRAQEQAAARKKYLGKDVLKQCGLTPEAFFALGASATNGNDELSEFFRSEFANENNEKQ